MNIHLAIAFGSLVGGYRKEYGMEMLALYLGECCIPYEMTAPGVNDGTRLHVPVSAFVIKLDDGRVGLVDTGMDVGHIQDPNQTWRGMPQEKTITPVMRHSDNILDWLGRAGLTPIDVDFVVNTHLHFDHAGNNHLFTASEIFVQREQYEFALDNVRYPNRYWNQPQLRYHLLDGDAEIAPGVSVMVTPGHTPGHQSVIVSLMETGPVIICGDAINAHENIEKDRWDNHADPVAARESAYRLQNLAERSRGTLIYSHDRQQASEMKWAPDSYR